MAITLRSVIIRHERRLRLVFSNDLASGAFGAPAPSYYAVENIDGKGPSPSVSAALVVPNSAAVVELSLAQALVAGARYRVSAVGVPAVDLTVTPVGTQETFLYFKALPRDDREPLIVDRERLLYGVDLIWNDTDYQESSTGDLERVTGTPNVTKALWRGIQAAGLPWDPNWGGRAREYVDSPSTPASPLRGAVMAYVLSDPRVSRARSSLEIDESNTHLHITPTLTTGEELEKVSVTVPNG